jgi:LPS O-antigen subunit length determinant protein (WzzB/FepE family)
MLGYQYTDLYRQTRIQETVFEFLTQQYEMAKIQEAKELPTVRVMDPAVPPERKSGPIRTLVVSLCLLAGLALASFWVIGHNAWVQLPGDDPRRLLAAEVSGDLQASLKKLRRGAS